MEKIEGLKGIKEMRRVGMEEEDSVISNDFISRRNVFTGTPVVLWFT